MSYRHEKRRDGGRRSRETGRRTMRAMENMIRDGAIIREYSCERKRPYTNGGAVSARRALGRRGQHTKIYHCRFCNQYHLTGE